MFPNEILLSGSVRAFFERADLSASVEALNAVVRDACGIRMFFDGPSQVEELKQALSVVEEGVFSFSEEQKEFGDFQTNICLAKKICRYLKKKKCVPEILVEPTCGQGNFVLAALESFPSLRTVVCVEIQPRHVLKLKYSILDFYLSNKRGESLPEIEIFTGNVFDFEFASSVPKTGEILVLGNPPWVTNSALGAMGSENLPKKTNYKKNIGLAAITGKSNFDLGEFVLKMMLENFSSRKGVIAFLLKNSVIKNTVHAQKTLQMPICNMEMLSIDAPSEFNADVDASLFFAQFSANDVGFKCRRGDFYLETKESVLGWVGEKFVSDIDDYARYSEFDGESPLVWRQGIKHDCAKVMELTRRNDAFFENRLGEVFELERESVFGLLKSSDLKSERVCEPRKYTILTQRRTGENPSYHLASWPKTLSYLRAHAGMFAARKSSIYKNRPEFSMFGVGDYSLAPYKVAISGFYKQTKFSLVTPQNGKPLLLDDTCYFLGFNREEEAEFVLTLLNSEPVQAFLRAIVFFDSKRGITKDVLMRVDLIKVADLLNLDAPHGFSFNPRQSKQAQEELALKF